MVATMLPTGCSAMVKLLTSLLLSFFLCKTSLASLAILLTVTRGSNEIFHKSTLDQHRAIVKKKTLFGTKLLFQ